MHHKYKDTLQNNAKYHELHAWHLFTKTHSISSQYDYAVWLDIYINTYMHTMLNFGGHLCTLPEMLWQAVPRLTCKGVDPSSSIWNTRQGLALQ